MRIAVISCWAYRDCWSPFFALLEKFWPNHPPATLLTDHFHDGAWHSDKVALYYGPKAVTWTWGQVLQNFTRSAGETPVLLMQEDFLLTVPVHSDLIERGLEQMRSRKAACVRLYPMPGADRDYGDPYFGLVDRDADYRVSCQTAIWNPEYLARIASHVQTPTQFELHGTRVSRAYPEEVLAFKREVQPWPMEYLCSAISRGQWNPDALRLCEQHDIELDRSMRPVGK